MPKPANDTLPPAHRFRRPKRQGWAWAALLAALPFGMPSARAQNATWAGRSDNDWNTAGNWSDGVVPSIAANETVAVFAGAVGSNSTVVLNTLAQLDEIIFDANAAAFTLSGNASDSANGFELWGATGILDSHTALGVETIAANVRIASGQQQWIAAGGLELTGGLDLNNATLTLDSANFIGLFGVIGGHTGGIVKAGSGNLLVANPVNTFTGPITVNQGTLSIQDDASLGGAANHLALNGAQLNISQPSISNRDISLSNQNDLNAGFGAAAMTLAGNLSGTGSLTIHGDVSLAGNNSAYTGDIFLAGGTLSIDSPMGLGEGGNLGVESEYVLQATVDVTTHRRIYVALNGLGPSPPGVLLVGAGATLTLAGGVAGGHLSIPGPGTLAVGGAGISAGNITVNGTFRAINDNVMGADSIWIVSSTGTVDLDNHNQEVNFISGNGNLELGTGGLTLQTKGVTVPIYLNLGGGITSGNSTQIGFTYASFTFSGVISGRGGLTVLGDHLAVSPTYARSFFGGETLPNQTNYAQYLTGPNAYSGGTTLHGGVLAIDSDGALGDPSGGLIMDGGVLRAGANFTTTRNITITANDGGFFVPGETKVTLGGLLSGAGSLYLDGGGDLELWGNNTYTGSTFIANGTLLLSSSDNLSSSSAICLAAANLDASALGENFTIGPGQILSGDGIILGNVDVAGTLQPGNSGHAGTLSFSGDVALEPRAVSHLQIGNASSGTPYSTVNVAGNLALDGLLVVHLLDDYAPALGDSFNLFRAGRIQVGTFSSFLLPDTGSGADWNVSQLAATGNLTLDAPTDYATWAADIGLFGGNALPMAQPYGHGLTNLMRYAMNLETAPSTANLPSMLTANIGGRPYLTLQFRERKNMADYLLVPQASTDLVNWSDLSADDIASLPDDNAYTARYEARVELLPTNPVFLRLVARSRP